LVCFFSAPQISHEMAWRITQTPPVPLLSTSYFIAGRRGEDEHRCHNSAPLLNAGRITRPEFQFGTAPPGAREKRYSFGAKYPFRAKTWYFRSLQ
jgi:hypothetical protein